MGTMIGNIQVYGVIYKITNKVNGKVYIGQTTKKRGFNERYQCSGKDIERVYKYHKNRKDKNGGSFNSYLYNSIKKYGFDNFYVNKVFDVAFSLEELNIKEENWIRFYDSTNRKHGYNFRKGGDNYECNSESKVRNGKYLICIDDNLIFKSYKEAERYYGISKSWINKSLKIKRHTYKNFKNEPPIFRKFEHLGVFDRLCCVCGKEIKPKNTHNLKRKYCKKCSKSIQHCKKINSENIIKKRSVITLDTYYNIDLVDKNKYESQNIIDDRDNKKKEISNFIRSNVYKISSKEIVKEIKEKYNEDILESYVKSCRIKTLNKLK